MNIFYSFLLFLIFLNIINSEPITVGVISSFVFGITFLYHKQLKCLINECCEPYSKWMTLNMTKLHEDITENLHGQHLVKLALLSHLQSHLSNDKPMKALLLSFNGMPGTGKNYVSTMIANSLYKNGMKSKYVHLYLSSVHFPLEENIDKYKSSLQKQITEAVKRCERNLFIFDEVQDMPGTLLNAIKPFVDNHESIDGVDYRKSIFLLLSNSGGKNINTKLTKIFSEGRERDSLTLKEMEEVLASNLYSMKNDGLRDSKLIKHNLITAFVPFLPLEKSHVRLCIKSQLRARKLNEDPIIINKVIDMLNFESFQGLDLATQGCKRIEEKLQLVFK